MRAYACFAAFWKTRPYLASLRGRCARRQRGRGRRRERERRALCCSLAPCSRACISRALISAQVCLVTASTAGIGLGSARRLGREGASVMVRIHMRRMCVCVCVYVCVCVCVGGGGTHTSCVCVCMCVYVYRYASHALDACHRCHAAPRPWCVSQTLTRVCFLTWARMHASA